MQVSELVERLKKLPAGVEVQAVIGANVGEVIRIDEDNIDDDDYPFIQLVCEEL